MEVLKFKTNIKCGGCIATVSPALNQTAGINNWEVDLSDPEKSLTVSGGNISGDEIITVLKNAGFKAERVK